MIRILFSLAISFFCSQICIAQQLKVHDLLIEGRITPNVIDVRKPNFSWIISSNRKNVKQQAFQILVSDNQKSLNKNFGNIWDSQWRSTAASIHNIYEGKLLNFYNPPNKI